MPGYYSCLFPYKKSNTIRWRSGELSPWTRVLASAAQGWWTRHPSSNRGRRGQFSGKPPASRAPCPRKGIRCGSQRGWRPLCTRPHHWTFRGGRSILSSPHSALVQPTFSSTACDFVDFFYFLEKFFFVLKCDNLIHVFFKKLLNTLTSLVQKWKCFCLPASAGSAIMSE